MTVAIRVRKIGPKLSGTAATKENISTAEQNDKF